MRGRIPTADPNLTDVERARLEPQILLILDRLRQGPAPRGDLLPITHRFSARIHDLREAGYSIRTDYNHRTGHAVFTLLAEPKPQPIPGEIIS